LFSVHPYVILAFVIPASFVIPAKAGISSQKKIFLNHSDHNETQRVIKTIGEGEEELDFLGSPLSRE
jgi:hypothetical protein